jgi:hypothetical protein
MAFHSETQLQVIVFVNAKFLKLDRLCLMENGVKLLYLAKLKMLVITDKNVKMEAKQLEK